MRRIALWLDDLRDPADHQERIQRCHPDEIIWVKTQADFEEAFNTYQEDLVGVFFDNDLGPRDTCGEGYDAFSWMENLIHERNLDRPFLLDAQTANPVARQKLLQGFGSLQRWWRAK